MLGQNMTIEEERTRIKSLVRKHVHDVRNYVNCANMEATLLNETTMDQEMADGLASIREQLEALDKIMSDFARHFRHYPDPEDF